MRVCSKVGRLSLLAFLFAVPCFSLAQGTDEAELPHLPFPMAASAYPLNSIVANEEGTTIVEVLIDETGAFTNAEIRESSGYPLLDDIAFRTIQEARLSTPPTTPDGTPTSARVLADVVWTLPLESAEEYMFEDRPGADPIVPGDDVVWPQQGAHENRVSQNDFPQTAVRYSQTGPVILRVLVGPDGHVADLHVAATSGFEELDAAALRIVPRFQFDPGTINGEPATMWINFTFRFFIQGLAVSNCSGAPAIQRTERRNPFDGEDYERWTLVTREGSIGESLILTEQGWRKFSPELVAYMNESANFQRLSFARGIRLPPGGCWLYDGVDQTMQSTQPDLEVPDAPQSAPEPFTQRPPDLMSNPIDGGLYTRGAPY